VTARNAVSDSGLNLCTGLVHQKTPADYSKVRNLMNLTECRKIATTVVLIRLVKGVMGATRTARLALSICAVRDAPTRVQPPQHGVTGTRAKAP